MMTGIHPEYYVVNVVCACGDAFVTRSTNKELRLEICSKCHPFFTGKQKLIDTAGRVERFNRRYRKGKTGDASAAATGAAEPDATPEGGTTSSPGASGGS